MAYATLGTGAPYGDQSSSFSNNEYLLGVNQAQQQQATPLGQQNITGATQNLAQAGKYQSDILSGNRETVLGAQAPEISSLLTSYDTARKSAGQLTPRGGGRSQILNELPYQEAGQVNQVIQKARPEAAKGLTQTAEAQGYIGATEQQIAAADVSNSLQFLLGKSAQQLNWAQFDAQQSAALGQAIGQAIPQLLALGAGA
jgi:hypothetical protein